MRRFLRRPAVIVPIVAVVLGGAIWLGVRAGRSTSSSAQTATDRLYTVTPTTMRQTVSSSGTIAPAQTESLNFTSQGTVTAVNVKAGQHVRAGQVLATLDSAALQSAVAQAQATAASAQSQLSSDENAGASSTQIASDQANLASANAALAAAVSDLGGAQLTSPIDGTAAIVNLTVGEVLGSSGASGTNLTGTGTGSGQFNAASSSSSNNGGGANANSSASSSTTNNSSGSRPQIEVISTSFVVNVGIDTTTLAHVKVGESATVTPTASSNTSSSNGGFGGFAGLFGGLGGAGTNGGGARGGGGSGGNTAVGAAVDGTVTSVGAVATATSGVATFPVVISVSGTPASFHAGAAATVSIAYNELQDVLAVPLTAVTTSNGSSYVTVSTNGTSQRRQVTTGASSGGQIEITSGLRSGEQVVVPLPTFARGTTGGSSGGRGGGFQFPAGGFGGGRTGSGSP